MYSNYTVALYNLLINNSKAISACIPLLQLYPQHISAKPWCSLLFQTLLCWAGFLKRFLREKNMRYHIYITLEEIFVKTYVLHDSYCTEKSIKFYKQKKVHETHFWRFQTLSFLQMRIFTLSFEIHVRHYTVFH